MPTPQSASVPCSRTARISEPHSSSSGSPGNSNARNIAAQISRGSWRIHMDAPVVGKPQLVSNVRELQITAGGRDYRLKISEGVRLQLEEIVQAA